MVVGGQEYLELPTYPTMSYLLISKICDHFSSGFKDINKLCTIEVVTHPTFHSRLSQYCYLPLHTTAVGSIYILVHAGRNPAGSCGARPRRLTIDNSADMHKKNLRPDYIVQWIMFPNRFDFWFLVCLIAYIVMTVISYLRYCRCRRHTCYISIGHFGEFPWISCME